MKIQLTTRTTEDGIPELTRIPEKIATTEHFILLARQESRNNGIDQNTGKFSYDGFIPLFQSQPVHVFFKHCHWRFITKRCYRLGNHGHSSGKYLVIKQVTSIDAVSSRFLIIVLTVSTLCIRHEWLVNHKFSLIFDLISFVLLKNYMHLLKSC